MEGGDLEAAGGRAGSKRRMRGVYRVTSSGLGDALGGEKVTGIAGCLPGLVCAAGGMGFSGTEIRAVR